MERRLSSGSESTQEVLYQCSSVLTRYQDPAALQSLPRLRSGMIREINVSPARLYLLAFGQAQQQLLSANRLIFEVKPGLRHMLDDRQLPVLFPGEAEAWLQQHTYCYELTVSAFMMPQRYIIMQQELNRCFGHLLHIRGRLEKRTVTCRLLVRTGDAPLPETRGGPRLKKQSAFYYKQQNQPLQVFIDSLAMVHLQDAAFPLLDETGYTGCVDIEIDARLSDVDALNAALVPYGLALTEAKREIDMVVISDII